MKPHIRKVRGIWTVRMCERMVRPLGPTGPALRMVYHPYATIGHGYTVREAYEDWKAQMQAQRA